MDRPYVLRRARGFAPLPVSIKQDASGILAVGGHLKNTLAISVKENVFISQHIGDLETQQAFNAFLKTEESLRKLYDSKATCLACDRHPEYLSTTPVLLNDVV